MAHFSSTQYNSISKEYDAVNGLPISKAIVINVERVLSPHIKGAKVLELACGTGFFTRHLLRWGATSVVGIDISQGMIDIAQADFSTTPDASKCKFMVADCTQPFNVGEGGYDLVFAAWLLNYSPDEATAAAIFENISKHLKPGGRLVTVMPHPEEDPIVCINKLDPVFDEKYGYKVVLKEKLEVGYLVHLYFSTDPPVDFGNYFLPKSVYEKAARIGNMKGRLSWEDISLPSNHDEVNSYMADPVPESYFDDWLQYPDFGILVAEK